MRSMVEGAGEKAEAQEAVSVRRFSTGMLTMRRDDTYVGRSATWCVRLWR